MAKRAFCGHEELYQWIMSELFIGPTKPRWCVNVSFLSLSLFHLSCLRVHFSGFPFSYLLLHKVQPKALSLILSLCFLFTLLSIHNSFLHLFIYVQYFVRGNKVYMVRRTHILKSNLNPLHHVDFPLLQDINLCARACVHSYLTIVIN